MKKRVDKWKNSWDWRQFSLYLLGFFWVMLLLEGVVRFGFQHQTTISLTISSAINDIFIVWISLWIESKMETNRLGCLGGTLAAIVIGALLSGLLAAVPALKISLIPWLILLIFLAGVCRLFYQNWKILLKCPN